MGRQCYGAVTFYRDKRDNAAHNVEISLGGSFCETSWLVAIPEATFPFDSALLNNGLAVLKLRNAPLGQPETTPLLRGYQF